ncbi:serine hydrolase domain-containing protein [Allokutzneria albata]|uniref:CubicO group peptidase, beta-lactamase class C family n=1 Tax=Allokutzneria albata TaxID=211114 RepID=A0A1G9Y051_ALLAB|nr:serine hydrolase domain-containing protein [Allokutzneria albata]SDN02428.1 CubicO group peptidase, beta-lactamase class C family [Allokutzneria albata]
MSDLRGVLGEHVDNGSVPGAVALVARGGEAEVSAVGGSMARDSIFRIASLTKPITAAAVMVLVDDGRLALDDPVARWLPELGSPVVVRTPASPIDDVVPANRPITVFDLLTSRSGHGFPSDFSLPAIQPLFSELRQGPPQPHVVPAPDDWMAALSRIPLLHQPGKTWLYNTSSDIQGVLVSRVANRPLPEFLAERLFDPLGMVDTGFAVPAAKRERLTSLYGTGENGFELVDGQNGQWGSLPAFASGAGGLVSTADDWYRFARMLLAEGAVDGRQLLSAESVRLMTTDHTTAAQREASALFLEGQGWGFGGSVDVAAIDPWNVPGRYGWVGGTGTAAHIVPSTGTVTILLSQLQMSGPTPPTLMRDFWTYAAQS